MTRAITYATAGDPADVLEVAEIPEPPMPGHGQIQVEVRAFPIHPGDLLGVSVLWCDARLLSRDVTGSRVIGP